MIDATNTLNGSGATAAVLVQLRAFLATRDGVDEARLPPEREMSGMLGVSRAELRKALAELEAEGQIWRHVGKGTFIGARPVDTLADITAMAKRTSPAEAMQARLSLEPELARLAALHARPEDIAAMRACLIQQRSAGTWREYENSDNRLHRTIAEATKNSLLVGLLDTLNAVRRAVTWGRMRPTDRPMPRPDHHSFAEHAAIVRAIEDRDMMAAATAMRLHLQTVQSKLLNPEDQNDGAPALKDKTSDHPRRTSSIGPSRK